MGRRACGESRATSSVLFLAALTSGAGCSWLSVTSPHQGPNAVPNYECTESKAPPVVDVLLGALEVVGAAVASGSSNPTTQAEGHMGIAFSGIYIGSAIYGFRATGECTDLKRAAAEGAPPSIVPRAASRGLVAPPRGPTRAPQPLPPPFGAPPSSSGAAREPDAGAAEVSPSVPLAPPVRQKADDE